MTPIIFRKLGTYDFKICSVIKVIIVLELFATAGPKL